MKKLLLFAVLLSLITAAHAQLKPTTFEKVSDSLWLITEPKLGGELTTREAVPISHDQLTIDINNRVTAAGACFMISGLLAMGTAVTGCLAVNSKSNFPIAVPLILSGAAVALNFAGAICLMNNKVYLTPGGVMLKLNNPKRSTTVQRRWKNRP